MTTAELNSNKMKGYLERHKSIGRNLRNIILVIAVIVLVILFSSINPAFIRLGSLMNIVRKVGPLFIISIGMTFRQF